MDLKDIQNLIKFVAKSGANEVSLEMEDFKITIKTRNEEERAETSVIQAFPMTTGMPAPTPVAATPPPQETVAPIPPVEAPADSDKYITIKSPIIGTFYRKSSPDKPPFVEVGQQIKEGDVLCIIEAMKLFNEIESEVSGKIVKMLVDDASPVEFDQPLFLVDPS